MPFIESIWQLRDLEKLERLLVKLGKLLVKLEEKLEK